MAEIVDWIPMNSGHPSNALPKIVEELEGWLTPGLTVGTIRMLSSRLIGTRPCIAGFKFGQCQNYLTRGPQYTESRGDGYDYQYLNPIYVTRSYDYSQQLEDQLIIHYRNSVFSGNLRTGPIGRRPKDMSPPWYVYVAFDII